MQSSNSSSQTALEILHHLDVLYCGNNYQSQASIFTAVLITSGSFVILPNDVDFLLHSICDVIASTSPGSYRTLYYMNLLVGVPMVCMYLPAYDYLSGLFRRNGLDGFAPLVAGEIGGSAGLRSRMMPLQKLNVKV